MLAPCSFNRAITFRERRSGLTKRRKFVGHLLLKLAGGGLNLAVYAMLVAKWLLIADHLVLGVAAGSVYGMTVNLSKSRFLL